MSVYSVLGVDNRHNLQNFALAICIVQDEDTPAPKGEPKDIETVARGVLVNQEMAVKAAFEVILHMRRNLKTKIRLEGGSCRLLSTPEVLSIARHAMGILQNIFKPYSERLSQLTLVELGSVAHRIAGVFHREPVVNVMTGSGIHFTGLTKLYYDGTRLNKYEGFKMLLGLGKNESRPIFYSYLLPSLQEIDAVVSTVMGPAAAS